MQSTLAQAIKATRVKSGKTERGGAAGKGERRMNDENREVDFAALGNGRVTSAVLQGVHLRKYFPVRQFKLAGPRSVLHAVEDTSLALYPGRALALVGDSGSGKTTVARILARLHEPTAGTILLHAVPSTITIDPQP